jgi:hypothetical protein
MPENGIRFGGPDDSVNRPVDEDVDDADSTEEDEGDEDGDDDLDVEDDDLDVEDGDLDVNGDEIDDDADEHQEAGTFTVSIKGPGLKFSRVIDGATALSIMGVAMGQGGAADATPRPVTRSDRPKGSERGESLAEYYARIGPKQYPDKLTTIAAYLQTVQGRHSFKPDELRGQFRHVGEAPPANLPRDVRRAKAAGWLAEDHEAPGQYFVTKSGLKAIETSLDAVSRAAVRGRRRRRAASKKTTNGDAASD